jgi:hypothetical protein
VQGRNVHLPGIESEPCGRKRRVHCSGSLQAGVERIAAEAKSKLVTSNFFNPRTLAGQGCEQSPYSNGEPDRGFGQTC